MARNAKAAAARTTRKRLTPEQKNEIAQAYAGGEPGNAIAARFGVSIATIYAQKRRLSSSEPMPQGESLLRGKLVNFAVKMLLGEAIDETERVQLAQGVRAELVKRVAAGL